MSGTARLKKELKALHKDPPPNVWAKPSDKSILDWRFIIRGPKDTPYEGGEYFGQIIFPKEYPFGPPSLQVHTPSGRFQPSAQICTSMSNFHPDTWNPSWTVSTILLGLQSYLAEGAFSTGCINASAEERRKLAQQSHAYNITNIKFKDTFPEFCGPVQKDLPKME